MATGQVGTAHVTLALTLQQYQQQLNAAQRATQRAAQQMQGNLNRVNQATANIGHTANRTAVSVQRLSRQFLVLRAAASAAISVVGVRAAAQAADAWVLLGARLRLVTGSVEEATAAQEELFQVAQRSRTPLADVATTFVRMRLATDELGLSEEAALRVTESFTKALIIGGASTQEASSALLQFSQALGRGVAKGDELRALYENFPGLFRLIGEQSGQTGRQVVQAALEEGLAVDKMINALISGAQKIDEDFSSVPITIGQSITLITNSLQKAIGVTSTADGSYDSLVQTLIRLNEVVSSPEFATGLSTIFQGIALVLQDLANGIERIGHAVNILKLIADQDFGKLWEQYLSKGKAAETQTKAVGEAVKGIAASGIDEKLAEILEKLTANMADLKNEAFIAGVQLNKAFSVFTRGIDRLIAPESVIKALEQLAAAGYDVTVSYRQWSQALRATFADTVAAEEVTRRVTAALADQEEALRRVIDAQLEYRKSREQAEGIDAQMERDEAAFEEWKRLQEEKVRESEAYQERIESGGRLPDEIDTANVAAQGLAHTLTDLENLSFDSVIEGIAEIGRQLVEAVIQAMIFRAIMAAMGGGAGAGAGAAMAPIFGGAGDVTARHGAVFAGGRLKHMARGGFITNRPMIMPMQTGGALIGEAGPEAVLPLKRMASGNLGVASEGRGGGSSGSIINIDARQSTPGTAAAAVREAVRLAPGAVVNAQARGQIRGKHPF